MPVPAEFADRYAELRTRYSIARPHHRVLNGLALLQAIAQLRGGVMVSESYQISTARYEFRCSQGHHWTAVGDAIIQGSWCPACANVLHKVGRYAADGLLRLQQAAHKQGGTCLSTAYEGYRAKYRFRCAQGHEWDARGEMALRGHWCPSCHHQNSRLGVAAMHALATAHGGQCLSPSYPGSQVKVEWQCKAGHRWHAATVDIKRGHWCPHCHFEQARLGITAMRALAAGRGGQCLSEHYTSALLKLEWLCSKGHSWWATPAKVKERTWCPECARLNKITNRQQLSGRLRGAAASHQAPET